MTLNLSNIKPDKGSRKRNKRVGRGNGSGMGTYCCRGMKGQKSRTGKKLKAWFEGGQTPFLQKIPKLKGFKNPNTVNYLSINLDLLDNTFANGDEVTPKTLVEKKIMKNLRVPYAILGNGSLSKKLTIKAYKASKSAIVAIEKAGGKIEIDKALNKKKADSENNKK